MAAPHRLERDVQYEIRTGLGLREDIVLWRNSSGLATHEGTGRKQRFGLVPGAADLIGIHTVDGVGLFFALETKSSRGTLSNNQRLFCNLVRTRGGIFVSARSLEAVEQGLVEERRRILG